MLNLAKHVSARVTPQSEPIPGKNQQQNNAGGYSFVLDCWGRLQRFLILGSEGGTYYVGERALTKQNYEALKQCAALDGPRTVNMVVSISESGRAPKNDPAIFALAVLCNDPESDTRRLAFEAMPLVCRTGTHLFQFVAACKELKRGWGRGMRQAVAGWYCDKPLEKLAYQVTKYRNRAGYTHRDLLRLSHPVPVGADRQMLYRWITKGTVDGQLPADLRLLEGFQKINAFGAGDDVRSAVRLIRDYRLTLEHVPNTLLGNAEIWDALLPNLPPTALIRNLGKLTNVGLLTPLSAAAKYVCDTLTAAEKLKGARVHPLSILLASDTYEQGHGVKGSLVWSPVQQVLDALESAFYVAFDAVEPTGKRHLLALDVSGSMECSFIAGSHLSARKASACMAMVTNRAESQTHMVGFSHELVPINISKRTSLNDAIRTISRIPMGSTDCAVPMIYALQNKLDVDSFIVYTDSETWAGWSHPSQALMQYRQATSINAKLIVVGMTSTQFTIADPNDAGMLDVVGFDSSCPAIMADFVRN